ncbi:MAG: glycosyltransferase family 4 protein [bacterium]
MMKVLVIHDNCSIGGGANIYRKKLSELLEKEGVKIFVFTYASQEEDKETCYCYHPPGGIKFIRYIHKYLNLFISLRKWINKIKPDIIHIHHNYIFTNTILLACRNKVPIIQTVHDYRLICPIGTGVKKVKKEICSHYQGFGILCYLEGCISLRDFIRQFILKKINKYLLKKVVTLFIAPSMFMKNALKDYGLEALFIPFGIDYSKYEGTSPADQQNRVLFIGDLYRSKGVDILLKAFCRVSKIIPTARLDIVGDGPIKEELKNECQRLNLQNNVTFYGRVPDNETLKFYSKTTVVVLPSIVLENSPLIIYEAMASANPIIGSRIGGIPELIIEEETGLLFTPGDVQELSEKILQTLTDKDKATKMGMAGRKKVESQFGQQKFLQEYLKIFNELVND